MTKHLHNEHEKHLRDKLGTSSHSSIVGMATVDITRTSLRQLLLHLDHVENLLQRLADCTRGDPTKHRSGSGKGLTVNVPQALIDDILAVVSDVKESP